MSKYVLIFSLFLANALIAQNFNWAAKNEYATESNPYYWKNRKPHAAYWQQDVWYKINAKLDDVAEIIEGEEWIEYTNNSPHELTELYFHLYQNAVQPEGLVDELYNVNKIPHSFGKYESQKLGTQILSIEIDDKNINDYHINQTIMRVGLLNKLGTGKTIKVHIRFKTYFDRGSIRRRMKVYDHHGYKHFNGVHWYPRISVYDHKFTWEADPHLEKEFYGNYGQYDVNLMLPNHYICEATGKNLNRAEVLPTDLWSKIQIKNFANKPIGSNPQELIKPDGTYKTWQFHAINVHDFAWTADPTYRIDIAEYKGIECIALAQENNAGGWQPTANFVAKVVETYSQDFGMYAYPKIVAADAADGMEYPMLTLDGGTYPSHQGLIAHEVGHNWFFGMIGSNETYRASLDEGFTQFLTAWSMAKLTKAVPGSQEYNSVFRGYLPDASLGKDMPLNTHSNDFNSGTGHEGGYRHVYYKTATMLYNLQYVLGDDVFLGAMQHYFNQWKICHPYTEDFRNSITEYAKTDLTWFFDQWLETTKYLDYKVKKIKHHDDKSTITLKRKGDMIMPIQLAVKTSDLPDYNEYIIPVSNYAKPQVSNLPKWEGWGKINKTYTVTLPGKITDVVIDPSNRLADVNKLDNDKKFRVQWNMDKGNGTNSFLGRKYQMLWRPDLWYNYYDKLKIGAAFTGNYGFNRKLLNASIWVNPLKTAGADLANYSVSYQDAIRKFGHWQVLSNYMAGVWKNQIGLKQTQNKNNWHVNLQHLRNLNQTYLGYTAADLPYGYANASGFWPKNYHNITLNLGYNRSFVGFKSVQTIAVDLKNAVLGSEYNFSQASASYTQKTDIGKFTFKNRLFASAANGNLAPENMLYLAGANPSQQWDNKFTRDFNAFALQPAVAGYYNAANLHLSGGLNMRGYQNYGSPITIGGNTLSGARGTLGASLNSVVEFGRVFGIKPRLSWLHINPYLFADAGTIGFNNGGTNAYTGLLADAGAGLEFTLKNLNRLLGAKNALTQVAPFIIRTDFPLFMSNVPNTDEYLKFRWVLGVGAAF